MRERLKKLLLWPWQVYVILVFLPLVAIWTIIMATIVIIYAKLVSPQQSAKIFAPIWAKGCVFLSPVWVRVDGRKHINPSQAYLVVSNHQSQYDILLLYGWIGLPLKWIMKKEVRKIPAIGIANEKIGNIFIDRSKPELAQQTINAAISNLDEGVGLMFFPEGTRSDDGKLLNFKKGAFRIAIEQQIPILPVTVTGTRNILPNHSLLMFPGKMNLRLHEPISVKNMTLEDLPELMNKSRLVISSGLDKS